MEDLKGNISFLKEIINAEYLTLCILIVASAVCRTPFIFQGFPEFDAACIAVSIIDFINHGKDGNFTDLYFLDVIPGYYLYIKLFMNILGNNYTYLTTVMTYTNVVFGSLLIIPCYYFIKTLLNNKSIAFFTTLTFIFAPVIFRHTIFGLPPLIPLFFFITSLYFFLVWLDNSQYTYLILSFFTLTATIFFKSDFVLASGAYLGLLCMRGIKERQKIVLTLCVIAFSIISFWLLRQWTIGNQYAGPDLGSTTSISNFIKWWERFFMPLYTKFYNKNYISIFQTQVRPIIYGMGIVNFLAASFAFVYYFIKKRYDILFFVISWSALPTALWLIMYPNSQKHNMLSVLPFLIIIFSLIYEKSPRLVVLVSAILVFGNFLLTYPNPLTNSKGVGFFKNEIQVSNRVNELHSVAKRIAHFKDDKIILAAPALKPYLLYEYFSSMPNYKTEKIDDYCYKIINGNSILCFNLSPEKLITSRENSHLKNYTIIAPTFNLDFLKEDGFKVIDNSNIQSWASYTGSTN
jgi:hypothetical protein